MKYFKGREYPDRLRGFCITDWNLNTTESLTAYFNKNIKQVKWMAFSKEFEKTPTTDKLHKHIFIYYHNAKNWSEKMLCKIGKGFGEIQNHVEPCGGKIIENEAYISKESSLVELGIKPIQGLSYNLKECTEEILKGNLTIDEIVEKDPQTYHTYGRTLEKANNIALSKKYRTWMTKGIYIYGDTGTGKSHLAFSNYKPETHYILDINDSGFWQDYKGQEIVIINEFRGQIPFSEILDMVDKYPKTVKQKGSNTRPLLAKYIIFTSSKSPYQVYENVNDRWDQFERRIKIVKTPPGDKNNSSLLDKIDIDKFWEDPISIGVEWKNKKEFLFLNNL